VISLCDSLLFMWLTFTGVGEGYAWFRQLSFRDVRFAQRCEWSDRASGTWRRINSFIGNKAADYICFCICRAVQGIPSLVSMCLNVLKFCSNKCNCFHQWHRLSGHMLQFFADRRKALILGTSCFSCIIKRSHSVFCWRHGYLCRIAGRAGLQSAKRCL